MADPAHPGAQSSRPIRLTAERRHLLRVNAILFLVTFIAYWLIGPLRTNFDFQLSQANNIIHGHLDLVAEYSHNLNILERVLYDGQGFCIPLDDPRGPEVAEQIENPRITAECKHYMQHSLGPALLLVPLAMIWGLDVNQSIVSAVIGGLTALLVFGIARRFTRDSRTQLWLTALAMFGTTLWYSGADGAVWHFAHTTAVFFLVGTIYATVVLRSPLLAGAFVGAAFMCRPSTILAGFFPLVAFADQWLPSAAGVAAWRRFRIRPLIELAAGVAPFIVATMALNWLRFDNPLESGYSYSEQFHQIPLQGLWEKGIFSVGYLGSHVAVFWEQMPIFANRGSFVWPSWTGLAIWVTSPPFFYGLFIHIRSKNRLALALASAVALACATMLALAVWTGLAAPGSPPATIPLGIQLAPLWLLVAGAVIAALLARDRLVLACWAAIIPITFVNWTFAATGWAQFGYRYALDFMPFLFLLVVIAVAGQRLRWHHRVLLGLAMIVNLWGPLWIFKFAPAELFGWTWISY